MWHHWIPCGSSKVRNAWRCIHLFLKSTSCRLSAPSRSGSGYAPTQQTWPCCYTCIDMVSWGPLRAPGGQAPLGQQANWDSTHSKPHGERSANFFDDTNTLYMICLVYDLSCIRSVLYMTCLVYDLLCICCVLYMTCFLYDQSCIWPVLYMSCLVYDMSGIWHVSYNTFLVYVPSCGWPILYMTSLLMRRPGNIWHKEAIALCVGYCHRILLHSSRHIV